MAKKNKIKQKYQHLKIRKFEKVLKLMETGNANISSGSFIDNSQKEPIVLHKHKPLKLQIPFATIED